MLLLLKQTAIIYLLVISTKSHSANHIQTTQIDNTGCIFHYADTEHHSHFHFYYCTRDVRQIHTWATCLEQCCPDMPPGNFTASEYSIDVCEEYNSGPSIVLIVLGIMLAGVCLVGLIVCLIFALCRLMRQRNSVVQQIVEGPEWDNQYANIALFSLKWSLNASKNNQLNFTDDPCAICLEGTTTAELFCRHQFHPKCIGGWLKKSQDCPCCRHAVREVKIYCEICRWRYYICSRTMMTIFAKKLPKSCKYCEGDLFFEDEEVNYTGVEAESKLKVLIEQSHQALGSAHQR